VNVSFPFSMAGASSCFVVSQLTVVAPDVGRLPFNVAVLAVPDVAQRNGWRCAASRLFRVCIRAAALVHRSVP